MQVSLYRKYQPQVVTTLKNTARPVTDLPFPAITICASGLHMDNVERKLADNFARWRTKNIRNENNKEAIESDIEEYMRTTFQIELEKGEGEPVNILDILDTMIAPNVDASVVANGIRENVFACKKFTQTNNQTNPTARRKKRLDSCVHSCTNSNFKLSGTNCFGVFSKEGSFAEAITECCKEGAHLATITNAEDDNFVRSLMQSGEGYWIGLNDLKEEGTFRWQDDSILTYHNWKSGDPNGTTTENCVLKTAYQGTWIDRRCNLDRRFVCSMPALDSCNPTASTAILGCPVTSTTTNADDTNCQNYAYACQNTQFSLYGSRCFYVAPYGNAQTLSYNDATSACRAFGAQLAKLTDSKEEEFLESLYDGSKQIWIGLNDIDIEGSFVWPDESTPTYTNWQDQKNNNEEKDCIMKNKDDKKWTSSHCTNRYGYACSTQAQSSCPTTATSVVENTVNKRTCIQPKDDDQSEANSNVESTLPNVDVFVNPAKKKFKEEVVKEKKEIAQNYFRTVDMQSLYPELFGILWESTLPCFGKEEQMLSSCQLAGSEVNCSELFTKVPTDAGMCCALNSLDSLKDSTYQRLVKELQQGDSTTKKTKVKSEVGQRNGLRLTVDLHSNSVSFGTLDQEYNAFNIFIGHPTDFPMMKEKSLKVQPGREHFIDLSAVFVSTKDIKDLAPEARECFFADEGNLDFYQNYTFSNCRLECAIKKSEKIFGCVPWHLPRVRNILKLLKLLKFCLSGGKLENL